MYIEKKVCLTIAALPTRSINATVDQFFLQDRMVAEKIFMTSMGSHSIEYIGWPKLLEGLPGKAGLDNLEKMRLTAAPFSTATVSQSFFTTVFEIVHQLWGIKIILWLTWITLSFLLSQREV